MKYNLCLLCELSAAVKGKTPTIYLLSQVTTPGKTLIYSKSGLIWIVVWCLCVSVLSYFLWQLKWNVCWLTSLLNGHRGLSQRRCFFDFCVSGRQESFIIACLKCLIQSHYTYPPASFSIVLFSNVEHLANHLLDCLFWSLRYDPTWFKPPTYRLTLSPERSLFLKILTL